MNTKKAFSFRQLLNVLPLLFLLISFGASAQLGTITISEPGTVSETAGNVSFIITWDGGTAAAMSSLDLSYGGTAVDGSDFSGVANVDISGNDGSGLIVMIPLTDDNLVEADNETLIMSISGINFETATSSTDTGTATITSDDTAVISVSGATIDEGSGDVVFTLSLSNPVDQVVGATLTFTDGTATAGSDYTNPGAAAHTWTAGTNSDISVNIVQGTNDDVVERNETINAGLSVLVDGGYPSDVTLGSNGTGTINNDDFATVSINSDSQTEGTSHSFTASMTLASDADVTVSFSTSDGTATTADSDYTGVGATTMTISAGNTTSDASITVNTGTDSKVELSEAFNVGIGSLNNNGRSGITLGTAAGTGTITNDDQAVITITGVTASEGNSGTQVYGFTATLTGQVDQAVQVGYATADGTATTADSDYDNTSGTITFSDQASTEDETINVTVNGDVFEEANQSFTVDLTSASINAGGRNVILSGNVATLSATGTINNDDTAEVTVAQTGGTDLDEGVVNPADRLTFTATLSEPANGTVTVDFTYQGTDPGLPADVTASSGTFTFNDTETTATITFDDVDDDLDENASESLTYMLTNVSGNGKDVPFVIGAANSETFTVADDDPAPSVTLSAGATNIAEEGGSTDITATLNAVSALDVTVPLSLAASNHEGNGTDFSLTMSITIPAGDLFASQTLTGLSDLIDDDAEVVIIDMETPTNGLELTPQQVSVTIDDDDNAPVVTIDAGSGTEGGSISMDVNLSNPSDGDITLQFSATDGSAVVGTDLNATIAGLSFAAADQLLPGGLTQSISVDLSGAYDDNIDESTEDFTVSIASFTGTVSVGDTGLGTINDNDNPPTVTVGDASGTEPGTVTFVVTLSNPSSTDVILDFSTTGGTATSDVDFDAAPDLTTHTFTAASMASGTLTQNVVVNLLDDNIDEVANEPEQFAFNVAANAGNTAALGTISGATGSITDDDDAPTVLVTAGAATAEGASQSFTVELSHPSDQAIVLNYTTDDDGDAVSGTDFSATSGTWNFAALATTPTEGAVTVAHTADNIDEGADDAGSAEDYSFDVTYNSGNPIGTVTNATGSIIDDDVAPAITISDPSTAEGSTADFVFSITNGQVSENAIEITVNTALDAGASAAEANDFTAVTSGTVTFAALQSTSETLSVTTTDDAIDEVGDSASETFLVTASQASGYTLTSLDSEATGTITDADATPTLTISDPSGGETAGTVVFGLSLDIASSEDIVIDLSTTPGTATGGGVDFNDTPDLTTVTFTGDEASPNTTPDEGNVTVTVIDDEIYEPGPDETLTLSASLSSGTVSISDTGDGTIADNEPAAVVTISDATVTEGGQLSFTVSLDREVDETVTVQVSTIDGTAVDADTGVGTDDYTGFMGTTVTFVANDTEETVTVDTNADNIHEGAVGDSENMFLRVTSLNTMNVTGLNNQGEGTITHDDVPPIVILAISDNGVEEDTETATVQAVLTGNTTVLTVSVDVAVTTSVAVAGTDFNVDEGNSSFTLSVSPGATLSNQATLTPVQDIIYEGDEAEKVTFAITGVTNGTESGTQEETMEILDAESAPVVNISSETEDEGTNLVFTVELGAFMTNDIVSAKDIEIDVTTITGSAEEDVDYTGNMQTVTIPAGSDNVTFTVTGTNDDVYEPLGAETFTVEGTLAGASPGGIDVGGVNTGTGTITDTDSAPVIELSVDNSSIAENGGTATITATLTGATTSEEDITIDWTLPGAGTATDTDDYTHDAGSDQTVILAGASSGSFTISSVDDLIFESPNETIIVDMAVTNGTEGTSNQITVTILDDEPAPQISISLNDASIDEDGSTSVTASIDNGVTNSSDMVVSLSYAAGAGNTTYDLTHTDLSVKTATVTISANGTSSNAGTITGNANDNDEPDEVVDISISGITNGGVNGATTTESLTLLDNDADETVTLSLEDATITENGATSSTNVVASLSDNSEKEITVNLLYEDADDASGDTADDADYTAVAQIVIAVNSSSNTALITADSDGYYEPEAPETLGISVASLVNGTDAGSDLTLNIDAVQTNPAISIGNASDVTEGGDLVYTVSLNDEGSGILVSEDVDVTFSVGAGTSTDFVLGATDDYNTDVTTQTVTITSGNSTGTLTIPTIDDGLWEDTETLDVDVLAGSSANDPSYLVNSGNGLGNVLDNDSEPTISLSTDATINEDDGNYTVTATLSAASGKDIDIAWLLAGTAQGSGTDYSLANPTTPPTTITTTAGVTGTTATFEIDPINDGLDENDETITINLTSPDITVTDADQTLTLTDAADNLPPNVTVTVAPGGQQLESADHTVTATLDALSGKDITVTFSRNTGSSTADESDYTIGSILVSAGSMSSTTTLDINDDDVWEGGIGTTEDLVLIADVATSVGTLVANGGALTASEFTVMIEDNEVTPEVRLSFSSNAIAEDGSASTITFSLVDPADGVTPFTNSVTDVVVPLDITGDATDIDDYVISGDNWDQGNYEVTIPINTSSTTIDLTSVSDNLYEGGNESAILSVLTPSGANIYGGTQNGVVAIIEGDDDPVITIDDASAYEEDGMITFNIFSTPPSDEDVVVDVDFVDNTAVSSGTGPGEPDYNSSTVQVTIAAGATSTTADVPLTNDDVFEMDENFNVSISHAGTTTYDAALDFTDTAVGTVLNDDVSDDPRPTVTLSDDSPTIVENGGVNTITALLSAASTETVTVNLGVAGTSTAEGTDYNTGTLSIVIAPGATSGTTTVTSLTDVIDEGDGETVVLEITSVTNGTEDGTQEITTTITDDDAAPTVAIDDASAAENGTLTFDVYLTNPSDADITVNVSTAIAGTGSGYAISGTDYTALTSQAVVIAAGSLSTTVEVTMVDDNIDEVNETFTLEISSTSGGVSGVAPTSDGVNDDESDTATGTISDDNVNDPTPEVNFDAVSFSGDEDTGSVDGSIDFTFTLSNPSSEDIGLDFTTSDLDAIGGLDYVSLSSQSMSITAGMTTGTITVTTLIDDIDEVDETFDMSISNGYGGVGGMGVMPGSGIGIDVTGVITDNDAQPSLTFDAPAVSVIEDDGVSADGAMEFPFTLSNPSSEDITVNFTATGSGTEVATDDVDFSTTVGSVVIMAGSLTGTAVVDITYDEIDEFDQTLTVSTSTSTGGVANGGLASGDSKEGTITDNDDPPAVLMSVLDDNLDEAIPESTDVIFTLLGDTEKDVTVDLVFNDGIPAAMGIADLNDDYTISGTQVLIPAGDAQTSLTVTAVDEAGSLDEVDETIFVEIDAVTNGTESGGVQDEIITIADGDLPSVVSLSSDATVQEGSGGAGNQATITATLDRVSAKDISIDVQVAAGSEATDITDFAIDVVTIDIPAGDMSATTTLTTVGDDIDEPHEDAVIEIASGVNSGNDVSTSDVNITDGTLSTITEIQDDENPPTVSITGDASVNENVGQITYTLSLSEASNRDITINLATSGSVTEVGSTGDPSDYDGLSAMSVTILAGSTSGTVTTNINDDSYYEENPESLTVSIAGIDPDDGNPPAVVATVNSGSVTTSIIDNEAAPIVSISQDVTSVNEEDALDVNSFFASFSGATQLVQGDVTVSMAITGTATQGTDYTMSGTSIVIPAGFSSNTANVTLTPVDDQLDEEDETVIFTNTVDVGTISSGDTFTTTIIDDEVGPEVTLSIDQGFILESGGQAVITATLAELSGLDVTVTLTPSNISGLATPSLDYDVPTEIVVPAGSMSAFVTLSSITDEIVEDDETALIIATGATNGVIAADPNDRVSVVILDLGFSVEFVQEYVTTVNSTNIGFNLIDGVDDATFNYTITDSQGLTLTGSGTITNTTQQLVTGLDLSGMADGILTLSVTLSDGITTSEPQTDTIEKIGSSTADISQGFSPNGDGVNDTWQILGIDEIPNNTVKVFNRYGTIVWSTTQYHNTNNAFDGNSNANGVSSSSGLPDGTYFYVINLNGEIKKGFVVIRR